MTMTQQLASRFGRHSQGFRSSTPLDDDQLRTVAPSIFADNKHASRSDRYTYIPTGDIVRGLRKQGFSPFMVCQTRVRDEGKREHAKHMLRLRHASQIDAAEANEIVLLNSHDGTSSYQMLAGVFRFVCSNGMVSGDTSSDIRVRHSGDILNNVIEGAFKVMEDFERVDGQMNGMKALSLNEGEQGAFARAALALRYDTELAPSPITEAQLLYPRRQADDKGDLWTTFNRVQENFMRGGLQGRTVTLKRTTTRTLVGIDASIKLNRALWVLAEEMRRFKA